MSGTGFTGIHQTARRLGHLTWFEQQLFEQLGAWSTDEPEPAFRIAFAEHSRHHGRRAELLTGHTPFLWDRAEEPAVVPPNAALVQFVEGLAVPPGPDSGIERGVAAYRVALPALARSYDAHLGELSPVADRPVERIMRSALAEVAADIEAGRAVLTAVTVDRPVSEVGRTREETLTELLRAAGGVTGDGG